MVTAWRLVVPEFHTNMDGLAALVRLFGLVARTQLSCPQIDARIPRSDVRSRDVPTPWAAKGMVMRSIVEAAGDRELDTTDGVRVVEPDGSWVFVLPDPAEAVTHLWAEADDRAAAERLLDQWCGVVERTAGRSRPNLHRRADRLACRCGRLGWRPWWCGRSPGPAARGHPAVSYDHRVRVLV